MPLTERIRASRMRDIRTSGLKRGEEAVSLSLPYSTAASHLAIGWYLANLLFGGISTTTDTSGIF
jgi:hypothetical protein